MWHYDEIMHRVQITSDFLKRIICSVLCCHIFVATEGDGWAQKSEKTMQAGHRFIRTNFAVASETARLLESIPSSLTGVDFANELKEVTHLSNQITLNGSGVAAGDYDNDGLCDLYFCGLDSMNRLYRNTEGFHFEDVTEKAGVQCVSRLSTGAVFVDFNADFYPDLLVNSIGQGTLVFVNNRDGTFSEVTNGIGFNRGYAGMSFAVADMDGDQYLDFYITNYRAKALMDQPGTRFSFENDGQGGKRISHLNGRPVMGTPDENRFVVTLDGGIRELGEPDTILLNKMGRRFERISQSGPMFRDSGGAALPGEFRDWGLSARFHDLNRDGLQDLYVCNDFETPDRLWIQTTPGVFQLVLDQSFSRQSYFSMGVDCADLNRDGWDDILIVDMLSLNPLDRQNILPSGRSRFEEPEFRGPPQHSWNTILINDGGAGWYDAGPFSGLAASGWSWAVAAVDLDLDGLEDVLITNGVERDGRNRDITSTLAAMRQSGKYSQSEMLRARSMFPRLSTMDLAFRNLGNLQFEMRPDWGFDVAGISNGMALGDLDNDGDLDIIVNHLNRPASIYRNNSTAHRIQVRLLHQSPNTYGIGATLHMKNGDFSATRQISAGGRYLSGDQPVAVFPVPHPDRPVTIDVHWPDGIRQVIEDVEFPGILEVYRIPGIEPADPLTSIPLDYHKKSTPLLNRSHVLAVPSSTLGKPGTASMLPEQYKPYDFQFLGDRFLPGPQKRFISGGARWVYEMFPDADKPIARILAQSPLSKDLKEQLRDSLPCDGFTVDLFCLASDSSRPSGRIVIQSKEGRSVFEHDLPPHLEPAKLLIAPLGGSEPNHLLVAYRWNYQNPGSPPGLTVFSRNRQEEWVVDTHWTQQFSDVGITLDIETADLDHDSFPEFIVPGFIFTSPVILSVQLGQVVDRTLEFGVQLKPGPWVSITCLDLDGDPRTRPGLLFGNIGRNNTLSTWGGGKFGLLYPRTQNAAPVIEVAQNDKDQNYYPVLSWDQVSGLFPYLGRRFSSIHEFSQSPVSDWIPFEYGIQHMETLDTTLLVPDVTGGYRSINLPEMVQLFPVRDSALGDLNRDGITDLVLATGWHNGRTGDPMHDDVVFPLLLLGTRTADQWSAQLPHQSGFSFSSSMAAVLVDDWDGDGREDVLFLRDKGDLHLYWHK